MRQSNGSIDWNATAEKARNMSDAQLAGALADIMDVLPNADAMDIANGNALQGGYYRDEASIYRKELASREDDGFRTWQAKQGFAKTVQVDGEEVIS